MKSIQIAMAAACALACSSTDPVTSTPPPAGVAGSVASAGASGAPMMPAAGTNAGGSSNMAGAAGSSSGGMISAGSGGSAGGGDAGGSSGGSPGDDWHAVKMSPGCGMTPSIEGSDCAGGFKCSQISVQSPAGHPPLADGTPMPATLDRQYAIRYPGGFDKYDKNKVYKLLFTSPGCSGGFPVGSPDWSDVMNGEGLQIELHYYDKVWGAGNPDGTAGPWCFDDKRGPLTIEKPYIETLYAYLRTQLCFDEHRVFMAAHSSGGWLSNQFGNSYGMQIFRAVAPSSGGLAQGNQQQPTNGKPVTGIWWHQPNDGTNPFAGTQHAIEHALMVNGCTNTDFGTSPEVDIPFPNVSICKKFSSCPADYPIVLCREDSSDHRDAFNDGAQKAAAWQFFMSLP